MNRRRLQKYHSCGEEEHTGVTVLQATEQHQSSPAALAWAPHYAPCLLAWLCGSQARDTSGAQAAFLDFGRGLELVNPAEKALKPVSRKCSHPQTCRQCQRPLTSP